MKQRRSKLPRYLKMLLMLMRAVRVCDERRALTGQDIAHQPTISRFINLQTGLEEERTVADLLITITQLRHPNQCPCSQPCEQSSTRDHSSIASSSNSSDLSSPFLSRPVIKSSLSLGTLVMYCSQLLLSKEPRSKLQFLTGTWSSTSTRSSNKDYIIFNNVL